MILIVPWITFTADDVKARMSARELEVYEVTATEDDVTPIDRMAAIVAQVLAMFRGAIRSNPATTQMGAAGTLPDLCIYYAAVIGRNSLIGLNPVSEGMTDPRREEQKAAEKMLADLRTMSSQAFADDPVAAAASSSYGGEDLLDF
jgi:hypothetical protein